MSDPLIPTTAPVPESGANAAEGSPSMPSHAPSAAPSAVPPAAPPAAPPPMLPPTLAAAVREEKVWPTPLSIICFIVGGLGLLSSLMSFAGPLIQRAFVSMDTTGTTAATVRAQAPYMTRLLLVSGAGLCLAIMLIMLGIRIARRRQTAMRWARVYAVLKLGHAVLAIWVTAMQQAAVYETMKSQMQGKAMPAIAGFFMEAGGIIGIVLGAIMMGAMPTFLLIWFALPSVKAEVARWA